MIRTQVQLDEEQVAALKVLAAQRGVSLAALVREGVDELLAQSRAEAAWDGALAVVGRYRGHGGNVAEDHDDHLDDAYAT